MNTTAAMWSLSPICTIGFFVGIAAGLAVIVPWWLLLPLGRIQYTCDCSRFGEFDIRYNLGRVMDELIEFANHPCRDEGSDVMMNLSCLLHAVAPWWVWLLPGAGMSQRKGLRRYREHGCCRSYRNRCSK